MLPEQKARIEAKIKQLQKALGSDMGYVIGYYGLTEDEKEVFGRFFLNTKKPREMAAILCQYAKENQVWDLVVQNIEAIRGLERKKAQDVKMKSKLIVPKMGVIK